MVLPKKTLWLSLVFSVFLFLMITCFGKDHPFDEPTPATIIVYPRDQALNECDSAYGDKYKEYVLSLKVVIEI